ncbi:nucleotide exchange factor GrpE [Salarchaeum japonicum]|uniref:Protein GrpE n=1 Tax=Salarchaeum japonicum TaxID=555573 RepID=A0AAV3T4Y2_9EURY|nr:nucleotide exchange factor GrpE [Salarchaeum japonicum]
MSDEEATSADETVEAGRDAPEPALAERVAEYDDALAAEVEALEAEADELRAETADLEAEVEELEERAQRVQADFQNYKKRAKKKQAQIEERATEGLVEDLLDVRDNLARALEEDTDDTESLREGVEMTLSEFDRVLENEGVEEIAPDPGTDVDANRHEVMMRVESDQSAGTVVDLYRPGYEMGGKVLRPAQVTVADE